MSLPATLTVSQEPSTVIGATTSTMIGGSSTVIRATTTSTPLPSISPTLSPEEGTLAWNWAKFGIMAAVVVLLILCAGFAVFLFKYKKSVNKDEGPSVIDLEPQKDQNDMSPKHQFAYITMWRNATAKTLARQSNVPSMPPLSQSLYTDDPNLNQYYSESDYYSPSYQSYTAQPFPPSAVAESVSDIPPPNLNTFKESDIRQSIDHGVFYEEEGESSNSFPFDLIEKPRILSERGSIIQDSSDYPLYQRQSYQPDAARFSYQSYIPSRLSESINQRYSIATDPNPYHQHIYQNQVLDDDTFDYNQELESPISSEIALEDDHGQQSEKMQDLVNEATGQLESKCKLDEPVGQLDECIGKSDEPPAVPPKD